MRVIALIGAVLVANLVTIGGIAVLVLAGPDHLRLFVWLAIIPLTALTYAPLLIGSLLSYWDFDTSAESKRYLRRWLIALGVVEALGLASTIAFTLLSGAMVWLPVVYVVVAALLDVAALRIGPALRRRDERRSRPDRPWSPVSRQDQVRRVLIIVITFVLALVIATVGLSVLLSALSRHHAADGTGLLLGLEFAFIAAAIAGMMVSLRLQRQVREQVTRDVGLLRQIAKVVLRRRRAELPPGADALAARYAVVVSASLPFTLAYVLLLYAGIGIQQVQQLRTGTDTTFSVVYLVLFAALLVWIVPLYVVRIRRARAYARQHAELLSGPDDPA